jgi:thioredoxin 2
MNNEPIHVTDAAFEKTVLKSEIPVIVDFWAPWCGPCRMMAPHFEQAAQTLSPGVRLAKLNTEDAQGVAARYGIRSIPTVIAFRNGREVARQSGAMDAGSIARWVQSVAG